MIKEKELLVQRDPHPSPPRKGEGVKGLARDLRRNATPAERMLWQELRLMKSGGRHFRRQVPIGDFIADFACHYPKLVVELDGGQHGTEANMETDRQRADQLTQHGFKVLRFWNSDVVEGLEGVVDRIRHEAKLPTAFSYGYLNDRETPTPNPSPQGGGEREQ